MQRPVHQARHARPAAVAARSGMGPSCAVKPETLVGGFTPAGTGAGAAWTKIGLEKPRMLVAFR